MVTALYVNLLITCVNFNFFVKYEKPTTFPMVIPLYRPQYIDLAKPKSGRPGPGCSKPN